MFIEAKIIDPREFFATQTYVASSENTLIIPEGWQVLTQLLDDSYEFSASAYRNIATGEAVVAYTGTNDHLLLVSDWTTANVPARFWLASIPGMTRDRVNIQNFWRGEFGRTHALMLAGSMRSVHWTKSGLAGDHGSPCRSLVARTRPCRASLSAPCRKTSTRHANFQFLWMRPSRGTHNIYVVRFERLDAALEH